MEAGGGWKLGLGYLNFFDKGLLFYQPKILGNFKRHFYIKSTFLNVLGSMSTIQTMLICVKIVHDVEKTI